jgi:mannose-6-phosphate isomerase-like protein (cupin superfamily)
MDARLIPPPGDRSYEEFLRSRDLSVGVYRLAASSSDPQQPHAEDELYYVLKGRARFTSGGGSIDVEPGFVLFVPAGEPHRFDDIVEPLTLLVVFGPAEGTRSAG